MKIEDLHQKVTITLTYLEAEKLLADLWELGPSLKCETANQLVEVLDEYVNT